MKRNTYAVILLLLLALLLGGASHVVADTVQQTCNAVTAAYQIAQGDGYAEAQQQFTQLAEKARRHAPLLCLLVRRNTVERVNETLSTLSAYATQENQADLTLEVYRVQAQLQQLKAGFFCIV